MEKTFGFVGAGNMGSALVRGLVAKQVVDPSNIFACDLDKEKIERLQAETKINATCDVGEVGDKVDVLFIAVKPQDIEKLLKSIPHNLEGVLVVSIAAGVPTKKIEEKIPKARVVRVMPNTPAKVSEMASAYCLGASARPEDGELVAELLSSLGVCVKVEENLMDAVTGLSGSGPAYIYLVIQALVEGGVKQGLSEGDAMELAVQTVKGAAEMVAKSGKSPKELIDEVASPGGTTIEGLKVLEEYKVREAFQKAVEAAAEKSRVLSG
ncbi:MAG TPA: pyrroline-5-carboxylate reductase [Candidatus Altiarchaeales archaeon]|nr:pyrroline-5-carboxylate reductase [Candidatus Altiarchaeales archaeon]